MTSFSVRFGIVPSGAISNLVINGSGYRDCKPPKNYIDKLNQKNGFYRKLEESILKEGIRNPIFCNSLEEGTFARVGTSRLWIARKHKLDIPVIIVDYVGRWDHLEELKTEEDVRSKFKDQPDVVDLDCDTFIGNVWIGALPHYHLEEHEPD